MPRADFSADKRPSCARTAGMPPPLRCCWYRALPRRAQRTEPRRNRFTSASRITAPRNEVNSDRISNEPLVIGAPPSRSEEHTSELQSLMRKSYAVFCLKKKKKTNTTKNNTQHTQ